MKQITLILGDGYDDVISVTVIGRSGILTNISVEAYKVNDGDTLYFPESIKPFIEMSQGKKE